MTTGTNRLALATVGLSLLAACGDDDPPGEMDAGTDAGSEDAATETDSGSTDAGEACPLHPEERVIADAIASAGLRYGTSLDGSEDFPAYFAVPLGARSFRGSSGFECTGEEVWFERCDAEPLADFETGARVCERARCEAAGIRRTEVGVFVDPAELGEPGPVSFTFELSTGTTGNGTLQGAALVEYRGADEGDSTNFTLSQSPDLAIDFGGTSYDASYTVTVDGTVSASGYESTIAVRIPNLADQVIEVDATVRDGDVEGTLRMGTELELTIASATLAWPRPCLVIP